MAERDVGSLGEATLLQWCAELGLACNKATQDRHGWDYLIELGPIAAPSPSVPLDRQPSERGCLIQVKSTDGRSGKRGVKLSNWRRLATSPLPAFFLVLEFDGRAQPARAYLVHLWSGRIARVLKRLRTLARDDPGVDLRSRTLSLSWGEPDRLGTPSAAALRDALEAAIGPEPGKYAGEKKRLLDELGYEDETGEFKVTIRVPEGRQGSWEELWADLQLGLVDELETIDGAFWDRRFGIQTETPQAVFDTTGAIRSKERSPLRGSLEFRSVGRRVQVEADILVAALTPGPPTSLQDLKLRIRVPFLDLVTTPRRSDCQVAWDWPQTDAVTPLRDLVPLARVLDFLSQGDESDVWLLGSPLASMSIPAMLPEGQHELTRCILDAWEIAKRADLHDRACTTLDGLWAQREAINATTAVLQHRCENASIEFGATSDTAPSSPGRWAFPILMAVSFDSEVALFPVLHEGAGSVSPDGAQCVLRIDRTAVGRPHVFGTDENVDEATFFEEAAALRNAGELVRWWKADTPSG